MCKKSCLGIFNIITQKLSVKFIIHIKFPLQYKLRFIASASQDDNTMTYFIAKLEHNEKKWQQYLIYFSDTLERQENDK